MRTLLSVFVALAARTTDVPTTMDPAVVPNYSVVQPGLAAAGQATPAALAQLKAQGFKTVVNLRTEQEGAKDERVRQVQAVLDDPAAGPVLLHCASANRVGGVLAVIAHAKGKSVDDAIAEGQRAGLKSPAMVEAVRRVVKSATN